VSKQTKKFLMVDGVQLAYMEQGAGEPILFLHGNPTSSYLWRHIMGPLSGRYRCIAPDLVGMGDSQKLAGQDPDRYAFAVQQRYLDGFLEALKFDQPVILVVHDWGSALGFEWARRFPERVRAIVYMEAIVGVSRWDALPERAQTFFRALRSPLGEHLILQENAFVEGLLPSSILRTLTDEEQAEYRRPFREPGEGRRVTLSWPRQLPIEGEPREICDVVERYAAFLAVSPIPKLFIDAEPGALLVGELRSVCRRWPSQTHVTVKGIHYIQEDSPAEITAAIRAFAERLP